MAERSNGKKSTSGTTLDLMGDEETAPPRAARKAAAPAPAQAAPAETGGALFGGDEVDLGARHPADVPVGNFPAPSQIAQVAQADEDAADPFAEDDPFEDTVMARMLADEPAPLSSPLRAAREEFNLTTDDRTDAEAPAEELTMEELTMEEASMPQPFPVAETAPDLMEAAPMMEAAPDVQAIAPEPEAAPVVEAAIPMMEAGPDVEAFADPAAVPEVEQSIEPPTQPKAEQKTETPMPAGPAMPTARTPAAPKNAGAKSAKTNPVGLTMSRRYTQPGQDIWTTVEWELRTASIIGSDGTVVFEQKGVEIPKAWSQLATNVVVSKYFRGQIGTLEREYSVKQLIGRVADRILEWGKQGGYFATDADADAFHDELRFILLHQYAAFNSPVWFNLGWSGRKQAASACYINEVDDTMESILDLYKTEGMLFKDGSGSGLNLSTLRSSKEPLEAGGRSSGPISFMKGLDASAGSIKSGGSCLAPWTRVYTERGPVAVSDLVGKDFIALSYDPPAGRFKAKRAQAWHAGTKRVVRLTTDKGQFDLSYDHPVRLADGRYVPCEQIRPGQSLFHCKVDEQMGYVRVGLRRGRRDSEQHRKLHQLIAEDVLGWDLHGMSLHHRDEDKHNNDPTNLSLMAQADHAGLHSRTQMAEGSQVFQNQRFSHTGQDNGMAVGSAFWQDTEKADRYRQVQGRALRESGRAPKMHADAMRAKMLNKAYAVLSEGLSVDTPEDYFHGCIRIGRRCPSKAQFLDAVQNNFGGYEAFLAELKVHNHRAISVETLGVMDVYDVEVDCPTADDKSPQTGHNFVIWPDDSRFGTGIAVANTRRAACMRVLDIDHPDVKEFIDCKKDAEEKAHALIDAGYSGAFNVAGGAYDTVPFQNANHSVRVTDAFMRAVEADAAWDTKFRLSGRSAETYRARDLMRGIAEGTWTCGDPGMQYDTTINDWHTCADTDRIYASNPCCFVGETLIETAEGQVPFAALYIRHEAGEVLPSVFSFERHNRRPVLRSIRKVWIAGHTQHLVEVKTERGLTFRCTPEHRFLTQEGTYVEAQHLSTGTALCSLRCAAKDLPENKEALQAMLAEAADVLLAVTPLTLDAPVPVYDMEVEDTHNFAITDARSAGQTSIVVSNSEFMFLNSTACNLSSLNLMKFRQEGTGAFDTESFEHAVAVMITAQEIVVGFASYPTPKIEQRSHEYRPLGLGYANLGALLMAAGLPYDSDAGRAYAGAVTALMTGRAYHQSAAIARDCGGPFSGFAPNRASMLRVMGKHRAAVDDISPALIPDTLLAAARTAWDEAVAEGQASGYRNAQASVLAPTGCLVAGSLVVTDRGVIRLNRLGDVDGAQWQEADFGVLTDEGRRQATKFYVNGWDETRRVTTHCGYAIQGTPKHRIKVVDAQTGRWDWKRFADIAAGDIVPLSLGQMIGEAQAVALPPLGEEYWTGDYAARVPRTMTADLAELIGYFMGDGSMHSKGPRFCVANTDLDVAERVKVLVKSLFNLDAHLTPQQEYCEVAVHSVPLTLWWEACGFSKAAPGPDHSGKGYLPRIPDAVLATNDPAVYGAFLRGLYEADGTVTGGIPCWSTVHREFSDEVKTLLLALGVPTTTRRTVAGWSGSPIYVLRLRNTSYTGHYLAAVGFMGARKAEAVSRGQSEQTARHDYVYLSPAVLRELLPRSGELANALLLAMKRHEGAITRRAAQALLERTGDSRLAHALRFFYDAVTANEDGGEQLTYDLSVPGNVTYVANGFVSHNTIGFLMDCDTTGIEPDIAIVKYKSLVGGGMMKIVNQTVPEALQRLGYDEAQVEGILKFIDEHDTVEGAPDLKPEHLPIFDCAFRPMNGTRSIHYRGHIKMMAAAQPFISGAISKTCNVPNDATPEEIADVYMDAWKLGIKAVAIYRDGSKRTQPLNTSKEKPAPDKTGVAASPAEETAALAPPKAVRRRLPDERAGVTHKFSIGGHEGYLTVGLYPDTNQPGEIFIRMSKEGSSISGLMDSFATAISLALQYGVPLSTLVDKFIHSRFEPSGFTGNKEIPMAKSVMDYIFRYLALRFLQKEDRHNVGLLADQDDSAYAAPAKLPAPPPAHDANSGSLSNGKNGNGSGSAPKSGGDLAHLAETNTAAITDHEREIYRMQSDAPPCPECGAITIRSGACYKCLSCGTSLGCS